MSTVQEVKAFWEANPLFVGESRFTPGSREYFEETRRLIIEDCLAGEFDPRTLPPKGNRERVLDLGCGPGFWLIELGKLGDIGQLHAADLTETAIELAGRHCRLYGVEARLEVQNAERLTYEDGYFSHVNCQGVIHHTPDTPACVREIARVLRPGGTAHISVYYRHLILRSWGLLRWPAGILASLGGGLKGRGREAIMRTRRPDEIVRCYDGIQNPVGKCYSRGELEELVTPWFEVEDVFFHFFPARALPFRMPRKAHRALDRHMGFLIFANLRKR
jgi:2-polyprenyl-3-methyl-5-hydroxy-6-metoxy-1,4-benzoquinol methylase